MDTWAHGTEDCLYNAALGVETRQHFSQWMNMKGHVAQSAHRPNHVVSKAEYVGHHLVVSTEVNFLHASTLNKSTDNDTEQSQHWQ